MPLLLVLIPILGGGYYLAYKRGMFGHKPGGAAAPTSSIDASAAIQKQISALQNALAAQQAILHVGQATSNPVQIGSATAAIQGLNMQISQLQSQLAHAGTL
jgi:S-adenosylmethionine:tRNA-ribosyltransferase-isomerase (queuine synthetase)